MSSFTFNASLEPMTIRRAEMNRFLNSPNGEIGSMLSRIGRRIQVAARQQVGKDTGALAASIRYDVTMAANRPFVTIGSSNEVALIHHEGTRRHEIEARNAEFLRFSSRGRVVYSRSFTHPGTPANRYLTDNLYLARL